MSGNTGGVGGGDGDEPEAAKLARAIGAGPSLGILPLSVLIMLSKTAMRAAVLQYAWNGLVWRLFGTPTVSYFQVFCALAVLGIVQKDDAYGADRLVHDALRRGPIPLLVENMMGSFVHSGLDFALVWALGCFA